MTSADAQRTLRPDLGDGDVKTIQYGSRLRLGMLLPSSNVAAEPDLAAMLPHGCAVHTTRLELTGGSVEQMRAMTDKMEEAAILLKHTEPHRIVFHCTGVTTLYPDMADRLTARIEAATGVPATSTAHALLDAFNTLGARRIVLISPYEQHVNDSERRFFDHFGIEVLRDVGLGCTTGPAMIGVDPKEWYRRTMACRTAEADAYFLSCTTIRAAPIIAALERDIGKPVVTSNQAMVWHCLRKAGLPDRIEGYGSLFEH